MRTADSENRLTDYYFFFWKLRRFSEWENFFKKKRTKAVVRTRPPKNRNRRIYITVRTAQHWFIAGPRRFSPKKEYFQKNWFQFWFQNRVQALVPKMDLVLNMGLVPEEMRPGSGSVFTKRTQNGQFYPVKPGNHPTLVSTTWRAEPIKENKIGNLLTQSLVGNREHVLHD